MYAKRVQIHNYGPIDHLDISFPFEGDVPKPVVLVGENGSGKSILLSHIVNGLVTAKGIAYPESSEVQTSRVYKLRSNSYIKVRSEYSFGRVDFEGDLRVGEIRTIRKRREFEAPPDGALTVDVQNYWNRMHLDENDYFDPNIVEAGGLKIKEIFARNCVLYFPPNRFEEPAWLNVESLNARAQYIGMRRTSGHTIRNVINHSPLQDNQNWLFEVLYDRAVFEAQTVNLNQTINDRTVPLPLFVGYSGIATNTYEAAHRIIQRVIPTGNARFGVGTRLNRIMSIESETAQIVPNIFQLSSGETALLNLFLSILRDFDLSGTPFGSASDVCGIVVVDEIDLHLHAMHQHEILPALIRMFPKVQFVVTTHSPLFVLGMNKLFGEDGFAIYRMPEGQQISPEEFSEFGNAYQAFTETVRHSRDIQTAIEQAQKPIAFVEGITDIKYIQRAAELLGKEAILQRIEIRDGDGDGNLKNIWNRFGTPLTEVMPQRILLLFDCDSPRENSSRGHLYQRTIPLQLDNPIQKGVENLFHRRTLERAIQHKRSFINIDSKGGKTNIVDGTEVEEIESWHINPKEKPNICNWLCENGTADEFQGFEVVFELLEELIEDETVQAEASMETGN